MKFPHYFFKYLVTLIILALSFKCTEEPIDLDLEQSLLIDTLTIKDLTLENYVVAPNLATNKKLYVGSKDGIDIPFSFIKISNSPFWPFYFDSLITIDSVFFKLYSNDSSLTSENSPILYFSPDSHFNENSSNYLDYVGFNTASWENIGPPSISINNDTSSIYTFTELKWRLDSLMPFLADTLDSSLNRTFMIKYENNDSNFIELFSEEATVQEKDPKVVMHYRVTNTTNSNTDSSIIDTLSSIIYGNGDLSIIDPTNYNESSEEMLLGNGMGKRIFLKTNISDGYFPEKVIFRKANLILPVDSTLNIPDNFNIIIDPIEIDTLISFDSLAVNVKDPYTGIGYPYRLSRDCEADKYEVSIKNFLQNILMGNEDNLGFKIVSNEENSPFDYITFMLSDSSNLPKIEIIYVYTIDE